MGIEEKRKWIRERNRSAIELLKRSGIPDIEERIDGILVKEEKQRAAAMAKTAVPNTETAMTSELVYLSSSIDDAFGREYFRRLSAIALSEEQIKQAYAQDKAIASNGLDKERNQPWVQRYFILPGVTIERLPKPEQLTISELILITDDAVAALARDHRIVNEDAGMFAAACRVSGRFSDSVPPHHNEFLNRVKSFGWSRAQQGAYVRNECLLTERLKHRYHEDPAWTKETTDLKKYPQT